MNLQIIFAIFAICLKLICAHDAKDLDDLVLYKIDFELPPDLNSEDFNKRYHISSFYTHDNEVYNCAIPVAEESREEKHLDYTGLTPLELIQPMFSSISCSYRIEAYWSYEICHGFHIKQYHEEREGKSVRFQEYYLGRWSADKQEKLEQKLAEDHEKGTPFKTTKIDNIPYPYLEIEMSNGTLCDLNNEHRTTKVRYVCYPHGKNDIYSFKETSSCNYEAIILTSSLCLHPAFLPKETREIPVRCFNSPHFVRKPLTLLKQNLEDLQMTDITRLDIFGNKKEFMADSLNIRDLQKLLEGIAPKSDDITVAPSAARGKEIGTTKTKLDYFIEDYEVLFEFLFGNCLIGGSGWWKYEFCFGRHVRQFHKDKKSETEVMLGYFDADLHREWLKSHPAKQLRRNVNDIDTSLWNHYGAGSRCDKTGSLRETDIKLMCVASSSKSSVSMYLLEPKTCQYILVVESPMVCSLIPIVNEDGLISKPEFEQFMDDLNAKAKAKVDNNEQISEEEEVSISAKEDKNEQKSEEKEVSISAKGDKIEQILEEEEVSSSSKKDKNEQKSEEEDVTISTKADKIEQKSEEEEVSISAKENTKAQESEEEEVSISVVAEDEEISISDIAEDESE